MLLYLLLIPYHIILSIFFTKAFLIFFIIYAIISVYVVKLIMKKTKKYTTFLDADKSIHDKFHMFRRLDAEHWNEKRFLVGAILFSWLKLFGLLSGVVGTYISLKLILWGKKPEEVKSNTTIRKRINFGCRIFLNLMLYSLGLVIKETNYDYDYSEYLGKEYEKDGVIPGTYICNHTSWVDILIFIAKHHTGFVSSSGVKSYPLIGYIATALGTIFVDRDDKTKRGNALTQLMEKQHDIYKNNDKSKILVFPEGTTSNTTGIMPFKQGPFAALLPVKPFVIKFEVVEKLSLAMDVIEMLMHIFIILCTPIHHVEVISLPVFIPNDHLFEKSPCAIKVDETKEDKGEKWVIYAESMRRIMCDASGMKCINGSYGMKKEYLDFLRKKK